MLRGPGWRIISCCVVGNRTRQDNYRRKKTSLNWVSAIQKYWSSSTRYILNCLIVTIKEGNFALKTVCVCFWEQQGKPQDSWDQCWRLEAKANSVIHPERLDVSFWTFPYRSHHRTRKGHAGTFPCLQLALVMNLPCGTLQPLNELTELKQHLTQTQNGARCLHKYTLKTRCWGNELPGYTR